MRIGVHGDAVPLVVGAAYHILIIGIQRRDEECRLDAVAREHIQQLRRVGAGAVVKGEIDGLRVVGLDAVGLLRGNNVYVPLRRRSVPAVIRDRICERIAADFVRDYISADLNAVGEVVALRVMRLVARLLKARTCDKLQLRVAAERQHRRADDDALDACLVAGGIAHGVDDAGVGHGALDLVGDVAVIIVARGVALLDIVGHRAYRRLLSVVLKLYHRRDGVHHRDVPHGAAGNEKRLRMVNYLVFADLGCVHIAGDAHLKRFAVVFEYPADRGRLRAKLGVLLADLKRHVLVAVDGEGRMPPVDDEYRQNYQQDVDREYYARRFFISPAPRRMLRSLFFSPHFARLSSLKCLTPLYTTLRQEQARNPIFQNY